MPTEAPTGGVPNGGAQGDAPSRPAGDNARGRGRGRSQGRGQGRGRGGNAPTSESRPQNTGGARRGGRGGPGHNPSQSQTYGQRMGPPVTATEGNANPSPMSAADLAARFKRVEIKEGDADEEVDAEVCFICASPVVHESVYPCNHRTCHICCLRMRGLYKDKNCAHCRTPAEFVIFSDNATKRYEDFADLDIFETDQNIGIRYESTEILEDSRILLRYNCPDLECDVACFSWPDLHKHVRAMHHKKICDLCSRHKKVFTHEHDLFTEAELTRHMRKGDDNPGAVDQSGFKGHPLCSFCGIRFYGDDELYVHCREKHERCHVCDQISGGAPQYFVNYDAVYAHFVKDHFVCREPECMEKKFIAFGSEMDLKAHQLSEHGNSLSKDVRRDARVVDINSFSYRTPYVEERRVGGSQREQREGRGRGRGRDPNAEALPASSAQPLRRDEQAFQRQMAIHSAQSVSTRHFGGQLTADPIPAQSRGPAAMTLPLREANSAATPHQAAEPVPTPQDQARQMRHQDVIERATTMLQGDATKMNQFRNSISAFKSNAIGAPALIDSFFALFSDTSSSALGTLVREVADLYEDSKKAEALRAAWSSWRAINEDYPSLPAASSSSSGTIPLNWAVTSSSSSSTTAAKPKTSRVLKLKSSTAQSSRSQVSQTRSWGTASPASAPSATSSINPFPDLPSSSRSAATGKIQTLSWAASPATSSGSAPSSRAQAPPPRPAKGNASSNAFPALPPAAKPQSSIFGYGRGMVMRNGGRGTAPANHWASSAEGSGTSTPVEGGEEEDGEGGNGKGKKRKQQGKKQVLMGWG